MEIRLNNLCLTNFKGITSFVFSPNGEDAAITAENGVGKTTVFDSLLWLLFNKDSSGRSDFEVRPLDQDNKPAGGITVEVIAEISIDGDAHTFKKTQEEKIVKGVFRGYRADYYIDDVPKKECEYQDYIASLIDEDVFKMLTDTRRFNTNTAKWGWQQRRGVLLEVAGKIDKPKGFKDLLDKLKNRSMDEYKKVLASQKKKLEDDQKELPARIDELQRGIPEDADRDVKSIQKERTGLQVQIAEIDGKRQALLKQEKSRQDKLESINSLKRQQIDREAKLKFDTGGIQSLLDEKAEIEQKVSDAKSNVRHWADEVSGRESIVASAKGRLQSATSRMNSIRNEYKAAKEKCEKLASEECDTKCALCGQQLPADKVEVIKREKEATIGTLQTQIAEIRQRGNEEQAEIQAINKEIEAAVGNLEQVKETHNRAIVSLKEAEDYKTERFKQIDELCKHNRTTPADQDPIWKDLQSKIDQAEKEIGGSVSDKLDKLEVERKSVESKISDLNNVLAQADRTVKDKQRIAELEEQEQKIAQQIADIDGQLSAIEKYTAAESNMIESAVNGKFELVTFKLFEHLINGGIEPCCEALFDGVPYQDCSYGQKAIMGIDIINTLSAHYGVSVPLFIDNSESITYPIEANTQTIRLIAQPGVKKLTVETSEVKNELF